MFEETVLLLAGLAVLFLVFLVAFLRRSRGRRGLHVDFKSEKEREFNERHIYKPL